MYALFFFKQKTAYEMRISDWSSDVCSSDLQREGRLKHRESSQQQHEVDHQCRARHGTERPVHDDHEDHHEDQAEHRGDLAGSDRIGAEAGADGTLLQVLRSEEHTSELQSLMRISSAVFSLKKKSKHKTRTTTRPT